MNGGRTAIQNDALDPRGAAATIGEGARHEAVR
jgi:hypothetical protein